MRNVFKKEEALKDLPKGIEYLEDGAAIREAILSANDTLYEYTDVKGWGLRLRVKSLTAREWDRHQAEIVKFKGTDAKITMRGARAKMVAMSVVDGKGKKVFTMDQVEALAGKSSAGINQVYKVCSRLNGVSEEDIEEMEKNSFATESDDLDSD